MAFVNLRLRMCMLEEIYNKSLGCHDVARPKEQVWYVLWVKIQFT